MSMGMQIAANATKQAGTDMQTAATAFKAWTTYLDAKNRARQLKLDAELSRIRAGEYGQDAKSLMEAAGDAQLEGREEAEIRGLQLAQDVGRVYTGAAGAGIDVSSATARHVREGMRREGYRDMANITKRAANAASGYVSQATTARKNQIWANYDAKVQDINAKYAKKMGRLQMIGGLLSAAGLHVGQTGQNWLG